MSSDLVSRLSETLDELDRVAREGCHAELPEGWRGQAGVWSAYREGGEDGWAVESTDGGFAAIVGAEGAARHIARWDPEAVLRLVGGARRILGRHKFILDDPWGDADGPTVCRECAEDAPCPTITDLAAGFGITEES